MARKNPTVSDDLKMDKEQEMCSDMHGALYALEDKMRKPYPRNGEKLLPSNLKDKEQPAAKAARKHVARLHRAFRGEK